MVPWFVMYSSVAEDFGRMAVQHSWSSGWAESELELEVE